MKQNISNSEPKNKYSMFPNYLIDQGVLALMTPYEAKVYMVIARGCSNKRKMCRYSIQTIIDRAGIHKGTAYSALNGLKDLVVLKTWIHSLPDTSKLRVKRYWRLNWEGYSIAEIFKRQEARKTNRAKVAEKFKAKEGSSIYPLAKDSNAVEGEVKSIVL